MLTHGTPRPLFVCLYYKGRSLSCVHRLVYFHPQSNSEPGFLYSPNEAVLEANNESEFLYFLLTIGLILYPPAWGLVPCRSRRYCPLTSSAQRSLRPAGPALSSSASRFAEYQARETLMAAGHSVGRTVIRRPPPSSARLGGQARADRSGTSSLIGRPARGADVTRKRH
ncbi:hypothetical protein J2T17_003673 [Paenibacillus mucilaginosus]